MSVAPSGSSRASRSAALAIRISGSARSASSISARTSSARSSSPSRTQRSDQVAGDPRREHVGLDEELTQALGGAKGLQGLRIIAARRFEQPAHHVEHQPASG